MGRKVRTMANAKFYKTQYGGFHKVRGALPNWLENPGAQRVTEDEFKQARADEIKQYVNEGDKLYTTVTHVSRSGTSRRIKVYAIKDNEPINLSGWVSDLLDWPYHDGDGAIQVSGCGMDMCFHTVYSLSYALFSDGYKLEKRDI